MSLISPGLAKPRRWTAFWPLWVFLLLAGVLLIGGFYYWPQLLVSSAQWQRALNMAISGLIRDVAMNPGRAGWALLSFSFVYGVVHALGPGHGKMVIATWLATHPSQLKNSLKLTFCAALLQGMVAIGLVTGCVFILQLPARQLHISQFWLERGSYLLVGLLGLLLSLRAVRRLVALARQRPRLLALTPHSAHHAQCGCGHQHVPDEKQLGAADDWRARVMVVLSMGIRPCSGAVLILLFSQVMGVFNWGMLAALAMALGTGITLCALALLVQGSRQIAERLSQRQTPALWHQVGWTTLALAGGCILLVAAGGMWFAAEPPSSGLRIF